MRRRASSLLQVAVGLLTTSLVTQSDLLAQHAGGASMSSGHMGGAMHSSPSFSGAPHSFAPPSGTLLHSPSPQSFRNGQAGHWPSSSQNRRRYTWNGVGYRGPYLYAGYPGLIGYGLVPWGLSSGGDEDYGAAQPAQPQPDYSNQPGGDYGPEAPGSQVAENAPSPFRPAYQGGPEEPAVHLQPATTLIFKDGRPPVQVHNYALTGTTLYALDGDTRQEIPLSLLNVPATVETNRQAGIDFALPISH
jgi:hypothetical protein